MDNKKMPIKILQVCAIDETVKSLLLPLIDRLTLEGYDVTSACSEGKNSADLRAKGYKITNIDVARKISVWSNLKSIVGLVKLMKKNKYDIVHVHTPVAALLGRIAAKFARVPIVIYTAHGFYFHERMSKLQYMFFFGIEKCAGRLLTDYIFTQSEEDRQTAVTRKIIKESRVCTISNGVDVKGKFNPANINRSIVERKRSELGVSDSDKVIMFIGRFVREKGIMDLLEAFNSIGRDDYKLMLVGDRFTAERDMETYDYIRNLTEANKNIIVTGRRYDISDLLYMSNLFILPSYREGMPRSVIEAMAMGKPVIATNIRGCREEVVEGETGFLAEVNNPSQLKDRIIKILENQELEKKMGSLGRLRAEGLFDEDKVIDIELRVISKLIEKKLKRF